MTVMIKGEEVLTLLENNRTLCEAVLLIEEPAKSGDVFEMVAVLPRILQLIHQAIKSNSAIIDQIKDRTI